MCVYAVPPATAPVLLLSILHFVDGPVPTVYCSIIALLLILAFAFSLEIFLLSAFVFAVFLRNSSFFFLVAVAVIIKNRLSHFL